MKGDDVKYWFTSSNGTVEFQLTWLQATGVSHPGPCDADVDFLLANDEEIQRQFAQIDPKELVEELDGYGAWERDQLTDHQVNLRRILWLAGGDIVDNNYREHRAKYGRRRA